MSDWSAILVEKPDGRKVVEVDEKLMRTLMGIVVAADSMVTRLVASQCSVPLHVARAMVDYEQLRDNTRREGFPI